MAFVAMWASESPKGIPKVAGGNAPGKRQTRSDLDPERVESAPAHRSRAGVQVVPPGQGTTASPTLTGSGDARIISASRDVAPDYFLMPFQGSPRIRLATTGAH